MIEDAALYLSKKLNQMRTDLRKGESSTDLFGIRKTIVKSY